MARITKQASERRQEIIDTARELFTRNGFEKTQISDISKKMNVAQGLVYNYFKSKNELLYAVINELAEEHAREIEALLSGVGGTALERLSTLLYNLPKMELFGELIPSLINDSAIAEYSSNRMTSSVMPALLSLIEQGNTDGSWNCKYPEETVLFVLHGLSGFFEYVSISNVESEKKKVLIDFIIRILDVRKD